MFVFIFFVWQWRSFPTVWARDEWMSFLELFMGLRGAGLGVCSPECAGSDALLWCPADRRDENHLYYGSVGSIHVAGH